MSHDLEASTIDLVIIWYRTLRPLEKIGFWSLVALGAVAAIIAIWPEPLQAALGGALIASGTSLLIPVLKGAAATGGVA